MYNRINFAVIKIDAHVTKQFTHLYRGNLKIAFYLNAIVNTEYNVLILFALGKMIFFRNTSRLMLHQRQ